MFHLKLIFTLFILLASMSVLFANDTGCLVSTNRIYTQKVNPGLINTLLGATPIYQNSPDITLESQCISAPSGSCRVCYGSFGSLLGLITGCPSGFAYGVEVNYIITCPIDSYQYTLLLFGAGIGLIAIRKRVK